MKFALFEYADADVTPLSAQKRKMYISGLLGTVFVFAIYALIIRLL